MGHRIDYFTCLVGAEVFVNIGFERGMAPILGCKVSLNTSVILSTIIRHLSSFCKVNTVSCSSKETNRSPRLIGALD